MANPISPKENLPYSLKDGATPVFVDGATLGVVCELFLSKLEN